MSTDNIEKSTGKLFRKIKDTVSDYDLHFLLKTYSNNYNTELLKILKGDLERYISYREISLYEDMTPVNFIEHLYFLVKNDFSIPFLKSNSKEVLSYQIKIGDYIQNNIEELKSYNTYSLKALALKSPLYQILSDLFSDIDIKEVFDLEELIFKYEFKNWRKFIELINEKLNNSPTIKKIETLKWKGTKADFVELSKALILSDMFNGTQKEIVEKLSTFLEIDIKNYDQKLIQIKGRNNGSETLFLNKLKQNLDNYFKK